MVEFRDPSLTLEEQQRRNEKVLQLLRNSLDQVGGEVVPPQINKQLTIVDEKLTEQSPS